MSTARTIPIKLVADRPQIRAIPAELVEEGQRIMSICNACRYCEGYCAVFPALQRRLSFTESDLNYLANLCHNCGACYQACQYAPPHEFALNMPRTMAQIRAETYRKYAWPGVLADLFKRNGLVVALAATGALLMMLVLAMLFIDSNALFAAHSVEEGSFYALIPHNVLAWGFGGVSLLIFVALVAGLLRFVRDTGEPLQAFAEPAALLRAARDALTLRYLDGGGGNCTYPAGRPSGLRRFYHHMTAYGFLLCFAATSVATIYHYLFGWEAPYPVLSLPVLLGIAGGIGLLVGPVGLLALKAKRDPEMGDVKQTGMDVAFLVMLFLTGFTGLALLAFRETAAMGILLLIHLATVLGLFVTMPYGKFVHAIYRFAALTRFAAESRRPPPLPNMD